MNVEKLMNIYGGAIYYMCAQLIRLAYVLSETRPTTMQTWRSHVSASCSRTIYRADRKYVAAVAPLLWLRLLMPRRMWIR